MPLDLTSPTRAPLAEAIAPHWRQPLIQLACAWLAILVLFAPDWASMVMQWWDSSTYNHILFVPPIIAWLVWQRASELVKLTPQAWWPGLLPLAGGLFIWLLGDISGLATASHLGIVVALQSVTLSVLGPRVVWGLAFPLCYGLFLVPIGDELVPALQMITADITIALTVGSGIPAHIEGVFIDTPAGLFEVAEACSGVKFLVAMIALGTLVAHVGFRSWRRRAIFMAFAVILPILANGVRAWGTIYIAQSQGIAFAAGFDHIVYGWFFFAIVMGLLLSITWKFFDRSIDDAFIDAEAICSNPVLSRFEGKASNGWGMLVALLSALLLAMAWSSTAEALEAEIPTEIAFPDVEGWERVDPAHAYPWLPRASGADHRITGSYRDDEGRIVDVVFALYAAQGEGREAGAFGEGALPSETEWRWLSSITSFDGVAGERLQALGQHRRIAETWFRTGDWTGTSKLGLKLHTMRDRVVLHAAPTAMLILSSEERPGLDGATALADFRSSTGNLGEWMDRAGGLD